MHSMLDAAGSMQRLEEGLSHVSIQQEPWEQSQTCESMSRSAQCLSTWPRESVEFPETVSLGGSIASSFDVLPSPSKVSDISSKFDSAIGSQSDYDSLHSSPHSPTMEQYFDYSEELPAYPYAPVTSLDRTSSPEEVYHYQSLPDLATGSESPSATITAHACTQGDEMHPRNGHHTSTRLRKDSASSFSVSVQSLDVTWSETPQQLQAEVVRVQPDLELTTQSQSSDRMLPSRVILICQFPDLKPPLDLSPSPTVPDLPGSWGDASSLLNQEISRHSVAFSAVRDEGKSLESSSNSEDGELGSSEGSSSTITPESNEKDSCKMTAQCDVAEWIAAENGNLPTAETAMKSLAHDTREKTRLQYHEGITRRSIPQLEQRHKTSSQLPNRYRDVPSGNYASLERYKTSTSSLKRRHSVLMRFQGRHGSFNCERRRRKHIPVKRSHSDITGYSSYWSQKPQSDSEEDFLTAQISPPSSFRPIGRMIDMQAGRVHAVQLHKPPSGRYGIYISEGVTRGIFISRFADQTAEKFYSGLLAPGDEIVRVNGLTVFGKTLDYVRSLFVTLDSVVLIVIPVHGRRDWWVAV